MLKVIASGIVGLVQTLLILSFFTLWFLESEWGQEKLRPVIENAVSNALDTRVEIGSLRFKLPYYYRANDVKIYDKDDQLMIFAKTVWIDGASIPIRDLLFAKKSKVKDFEFRNIHLVEPYFFLYKKRDGSMNLDFLTKKETVSDEPGTTHLSLRKIYIANGRFRFMDLSKPDAQQPVKGRMNYANLDVVGLTGQFDLDIGAAGVLSGNSWYLKAGENNSGFMIDDFAGKFHYGPTGPGRSELRLQKGHFAAARTELDFDATVQTGQMIPEGLYANLTLRPSKANFKEISYVSGAKLPLEGDVRLQGPFYGNLSALTGDSVRIAFGERSELHTNICLENVNAGPEMRYIADIHQGQLDNDEVADLLAGIKYPLAGPMRLKGKVVGTPRGLRSDSLRLSMGSATHLLTSVQIENLDKSKNLLIDARTLAGSLVFEDIRKLMPGTEFPDFIDEFATISPLAHFHGHPQEFNVKGLFRTGLGTLKSDVHFKLPPRVGVEQYEGTLFTEGLDFDRLGLVDGSVSRNLNFEGEVKGQGFTMQNMDLHLSGRSLDSDIIGYRFDSIGYKDIVLKDSTLSGQVLLADPEGDANLSLDLDFRGHPNHYIFKGNVVNMDLDFYTGLQSEVKLSSVIDIKIEGDSAETMEGRAKFLFPSLVSPDESINLHDVRVISKENTREKKNLAIRSSFLDMHMDGNFSFAEGIERFSLLMREANLYISNDRDSIEHYYKRKRADSSYTQEVMVNYDFRTKDEFNHLIDVLDIDLYLSDSTVANGFFRSGVKEAVNLDFYCDSLSYGSFEGKEIDGRIRFSKAGMANSVEAHGDLNAVNLKAGGVLSLSEIYFEIPVVKDNYVSYRLLADQPEIGNQIHINAETRFLPQGIETHVKEGQSYFDFRGTQWFFEPGNKITFRGGKYDVSNLRLSNGSQYLVAHGVLSDSSKDFIRLRAKDLDLGEFVSMMNPDILLAGTLTKMDLTVNGALSLPRVKGDAHIRGLSYKQITNLGLDLYPNYRDSVLFLNSTLTYNEVKTLSMNGNINLRDSTVSFRSDTSFIPLIWVEPFLAGTFDQMSGQVEFDQMTISGPIKKPRIDGLLRMRQVGMRLPYLNAKFRLEDGAGFHFDGDVVDIPKAFHVYDSTGNSCLMTGNLRHDGLTNIYMDFHMNRMRDFTIMDTRATDTSVFYGKVVVDTGSARIYGTPELLHITSRAQTGAGSWVDIPISGYSTADRLDFVDFVGGDSLQGEVKEKNKIEGLDLDLTVIDNEDTHVRLIFDEQVGDIMEGKGAGVINFAISPAGVFSMSGQYELTEGSYLFTAENIVNKKFEVEQGSMITWNGEPYDAIMEIDAVYRVNASLVDLAPDAGSTRVPVEIIMHLNGSLLEPEISLELKLENLTRDDVAGLASYFRNIQNDEYELNKQVVSLLVFRRFTGSDRISSGTNGSSGPSLSSGVTSSISELVSNQLNYWISQATNSDVGVEVSTNQFQDVEVAVRASLFDDRVTFERNGTLVGNQTGQASVGDISVGIKLLPLPEDSGRTSGPQQGQLVLELFHRENPTLTSTNSTTNGGGVFYKKDFDSIWQLLGIRRGDKAKDEDPGTPD